MDFNEYLNKTLSEDSELKREYDALQPEYEIRKLLLRAREEAGMTQTELAEKCGIRQSNISRLEKGGGNPTLQMLLKIADALDSDLVIEFRKRTQDGEKDIRRTARMNRGAGADSAHP